MCRFPSGERDELGKPIPITEYFTGPTAEKDGNAWLDSMLVKRIQVQALRPDETTFGDLQKFWLQMNISPRLSNESAQIEQASR